MKVAFFDARKIVEKRTSTVHTNSLETPDETEDDDERNIFEKLRKI